jgi:hypothetical protein
MPPQVGEPYALIGKQRHRENRKIHTGRGRLEKHVSKRLNENDTSTAMTPPKLATHMLFSANRDNDKELERYTFPGKNG